MRLTHLLAAALVGTSLAAPAEAQDLGNVQDIITTGLSSPIGMYAVPGDNTRLVVVEQGGRLRLVTVTTDGLGNKTYALQATPFLDLGAMDTANPYFRDAGSNALMDQTGTVIPRVVRNGGTPVSSGGFTWAVTRGGEQGLLGLAFAPDYATSGKFYINYTMSNPNTDPTDGTTDGTIAFGLSGGSGGNPRQASQNGRSAIFEFQRSAANQNIADPATERAILFYTQPFTNHNGGHIMFGPHDGYLYIPTGDGGSGGDPGDRALNPSNVLGKLLRIDVRADAFPADVNRNYTNPSDNPYFGGGGAPEVWARGLRNPWKSSFDKWNGDLWIADVGQGLWEEVNRVPGNGGPGLNYGWRLREGLNQYLTVTSAFATQATPRVEPLYNYPHATNQGGGDPPASSFASWQTGASVVGGYVYRGGAIRPFRGRYFFADTITTNRVWSALVGENGAWSDLQDMSSILRTGNTNNFVAVVAFCEDNDGELFIVQQTGRIRKIVPQAGVTQPAIADIGVQGGTPGADGLWNNNDFVVFINFFFSNDPRADIGVQGGTYGADQKLDNNDFIVFIDRFFLQQ